MNRVPHASYGFLKTLLERLGALSGLLRRGLSPDEVVGKAGDWRG